MNYYNENDPGAAEWIRELIRAGEIPDGVVDDRSIVEVCPDDLAEFVQCHFFAGIAGWSIALKLAGWPHDRPVWTGSCPCQPFSVAGKQKGHADERHLWPAWLKLIAARRPEWIFGEQVAGAISHGWIDGVCADLEGEGYASGFAVLGAHSVGAPHIRQRLYWMAHAECTAGIARWTSNKSAESNGTHCTGSLPKSGRSGNISGLGDTNEPGSQGLGERRNGASEWIARTAGLGFWSNFNLIPCVDGKQRRIESGSAPLVARLPDSMVPGGDPGASYTQATAEARVMRLRGYGNSIVPELAAQFILSTKDL